MRVLGCVTLLGLLCMVACSGGEDGPRGAAAQTGGAGTAAGGSSVLPSGGSSIAVPSGGSTASGGSGPVAGSAPVGNAGGTTSHGGSPPSNDNGDSDAHVITWVPPYHVAESKQRLNADFGGAGMADGLSYLALQFWITDGAGTRLDQVSEGDISWFHDWARQHGVKILLCVDNNTGEWNWPEAVRAYRDNREAFAQHLLGQVMTRDFDGVDLDFEGIVEATADEQSTHKQFVETLATSLHAMGKVLTLDSFHGQWNAPNWNWWPDLLPLVDGITTMGYEQSGLDVDYQNLIDHATAAPKKLMIGVPSYQGTWQNHTVTEQLTWLVNQGQVGTAIWDASLQAAEWRQASVWNQLKAIKSR